MKLYAHPEVFLVSKTKRLDSGVQDFLESIGKNGVYLETDPEVSDTDRLPEDAGRLCYLSQDNCRPGGNKAYLDHVIEAEHTSVLEHSSFGFIINGVSRSLSHELVRHRVGASYSQLSQRYVDQEDIGFVVPMNHLQAHDRNFASEIGWDHWKVSSYHDWLMSMSDCLVDYKRQFEFASELAKEQGLTGTEARKFARQHARYVLPECTNTMIFVTFNAQAWRHFITRRWSKHADMEIRRLAGVIRDILVHESPNLFSDLEYGN